MVTATRRLSRHLVEQYNIECHRIGKKVWATPDVLPWGSWLARTWTSLNYNGLNDTNPGELNLSQAQELALWEKIIEQYVHSTSTRQLLDTTQTAAVVCDAWQLLGNWRLGLKDLQGPHSEDVRAFSNWAKLYQRECKQRAWTDGPGRTLILCRLLTSISASERKQFLPAQIVLSGFDLLSPLQQLLIAALRGSGIEVQEVTASVATPKLSRVNAADHVNEIEMAARWSRALLEAGEKGPIGIVVPDLQTVRNQCNRIFSEILQPRGIIQQTVVANLPFHISLGEPLGRIAIVRAALNALDLLRPRFGLNAMGEFLRSPFFITGESQLVQRAQLDAILRQQGDEVLDWSVVKNSLWALSEHRYFPGNLADRIDEILSEWNSVSKSQSCEQWAEKFVNWLSLLNWGKGRELDSSEYQAVGAWRETLSEFMSVGVVLEKLTLSEALRQLMRLTNEKIFQPKAEPAPVQIVGILEVSGLTFSHLWVAGMHAGNWPGTPRPNPFLPYALQRDHEFPHADAEIELAHANRVTRRIFHSAAAVLVSSPRQFEDQSLIPSPLFASIPLIDIESLNLFRGDRYSLSVHQHKPQLEKMVDIKAPEVEGDESSSGGVALLVDQAACPFRSFARHRLYAGAIAQAKPLLDAASRGKLVHQVMENIWRTLETQSALQSISHADLQTFVGKKINEVIYAEQARHPLSFSNELVSLEHARLMELVNSWLAIEVTRAEFEVLSQESEQVLEINGLKLTLRPDRVDCLSDRSLIIIDYKTGKFSVGDWFGDRPEDPQLPAYLYAFGDSVAGLTFASLIRDKLGFFGLCNRDLDIDGIKAVGSARETGEFEDWQQIVAFWRSKVEQLSREFQQGQAVVDPKSNNSCRFCDITPLCRIYEIEATTINEDLNGELGNGAA